MAMIFMSYRREDAASMAGWIHEKLQTRYGKSSVFRDIDQIEPGADFEKAIGKALKKADIFIALIGRNWLGRDSNGESRINSETDWIRLETQMALTLGISILPILVEGAEMPSPPSCPIASRNFPGNRLYL